MTRLGPILLLSACFPRVEADDAPADRRDGGDADADSDADTDADTTGTAPSITRVDPAEGTAAGGDEVEITGHDFRADTRVWFGDEEGTVVEALSDRLTVRTPATRAGTVDVSVGRDAPEDTLGDGFTFWTDHAGDTVAYGFWYYLDFMDGTGFMSGSLQPIEPGAFELYEAWAGGLDSCSGGGDYTPSAWDASVEGYDDDGGSYTLTDDQGEFAWSDDAADWPSGASFGFVVDARDVPSFDSGAFIPAPSEPVVSAPRFSSGLSDYSEGSSLPVTWSGSGDGWVMIWMYGYPDSDISLFCIARDDGSFTVPASSMSVFNDESYVYFNFGRMSLGEVGLVDGGVVKGGAMYMIYPGLLDLGWW